MALRIGWFSTGGEQARELLRCVLRERELGLMDVSVSFAFCDWEEDELASFPDGEERRRFVEMVRSRDIPLLTLSSRRVEEQYGKDPARDWRSCFGRKMRTMIYGRPFELGVLAGFQQRLDEDTCTRFDLVRLQPSLPGGPKGTWQEALSQVIGSRAARHGSNMQLCTGGSDSGPPITYSWFPLDVPEYQPLWQEVEALSRNKGGGPLEAEELGGTELFRRIRADQRARQPPLVTYTIKMFADGDVDIVNGKPMAMGRPLVAAFDLSSRVEGALARR